MRMLRLLGLALILLLVGGAVLHALNQRQPALPSPRRGVEVEFQAGPTAPAPAADAGDATRGASPTRAGVTAFDHRLMFVLSRAADEAGHRLRALLPVLADALGQALTRPPREAHPYIEAARQRLSAGNVEAAIELFYLALDRESSHRQALEGLADALLLTGRFDQATPILRQLAQLYPDQQAGAFNLAVGMWRRGELAAAEQTFRQLVARDEGDIRARYNLAALLQSQGKLAEARQQWQRVLDQQPELALAQHALGEVLMDLGEPEQALEAFAAVATLRGDDLVAWLNLAEAARSAGSLGRALAALEQAQRLEPGQPLIYLRRGEVFLQLHRATGRADFLDNAVDAWEKCLTLDPDQPQLRQWLTMHRAAGHPPTPETAPAAPAADGER